MNNKELLIKILIELRSNGITNRKLLYLVETFPPHYFINIFGKYRNIQKISMNQIINIVKIFDYLLKDLKRIDNFFLSGINSGWSAHLASKLSKRVYCLLKEELCFSSLKGFLSERGIKNIFLKKGSDINSWSVVSPFDAMIILQPFEKISEELLNNITDKGYLFIPIYKSSKIKILKVNKSKKILETDLDYDLLNCDIL